MAGLTVWRLTREEYVDTAFSGEGARLYGNRFNSKGTRIIYTSENLPLALLETIVGLSNHSQLFEYIFFRAELPEQNVEPLPLDMLPSNWDLRPPASDTKRIGDSWIDTRRSLALRVPSVVAPYSYNYLLNPAHPEFSEITIHEPENMPVDLRLFE